MALWSHEEHWRPGPGPTKAMWSWDDVSKHACPPHPTPRPPTMGRDGRGPTCNLCVYPTMGFRHCLQWSGHVKVLLGGDAVGRTWNDRGSLYVLWGLRFRYVRRFMGRSAQWSVWGYFCHLTHLTSKMFSLYNIYLKTLKGMFQLQNRNWADILQLAEKINKPLDFLFVYFKNIFKGYRWISFDVNDHRSL